MTESSRHPAPLQPGDTLGVVAPAGTLRDHSAFQRGVSILQEMGFGVKFPREGWAAKETSYLAGSDTQRAEEFNRMWADPEVKGIIALRGGFGCLRILNQLDFNLFQKNPKIVLGFSDLTLLLNVISSRTGQPVLHGPGVTSLAQATPAALQRLHTCLTGYSWEYPALPLPSLEVLRDGGTVTAPLIGGNLATLLTLLGTPWDFDYSAKILLLEDIGEPLYKIDRMLTQLRLAGKFSFLQGILLGDFRATTDQPNLDPLSHLRYLENIWRLVLEHIEAANAPCPIWAHIPAGHCPGNFTLPIGARITMDSIKKTVSFQR